MSSPTLLTKVQEIEQEASALVEQAETAGKQAVARVQRNEDQTIADIEKKAHARGQEIVQEHTKSVEQELGQIKQERAQSVQVVHGAAEQNRSAALTRAQQLFDEEFGSARS